MYCRGTQSAELLNSSTNKVTGEASEGSSHVGASHLDTTDLLRENIGSRSYYESSKAFEDFFDLVLAKLDLCEVRSTQEDRSFIFSFYNIMKVRIIFCLCPFFFSYLTFVFFLWAFFHFVEAKHISTITKISLEEAVRQVRLLRSCKSTLLF